MFKNWKDNKSKDTNDDMDMFNVSEVIKSDVLIVNEEENVKALDLIVKEEPIEEEKEILENKEELSKTDDYISRDSVIEDKDDLMLAVGVINEVKPEDKTVEQEINLSKTEEVSEIKVDTPEKKERKSFFNTEAINELKNKAKNVGSKITDKVEEKINTFGEKKEILESNEELIIKVQKLSQRIIELESKFENMESMGTDKVKTSVVLSESISIDDLISKMERSSDFMKQIAFYLKNEVNNVASNFIEERMESILSRIKAIKLEELKLQNKYQVSLADLEEVISGKKRELNNVEVNLVEKRNKIDELHKLIENEEQTLKNIEEQTNSQNKAMLELMSNVEDEKKKVIGRLEDYKAEQKVIADKEILDYSEKVKVNLKEEIDLELKKEIDDKLDRFHKEFESLSLEMRNKLLDKLFNK